MSHLFDIPDLSALPPANLAATVPANRRAHTRHEVDYAATLRFADGSSETGRVHDVSPMGALIEPRAGARISETFRLIIPAVMFSADCEIRHRTDGRIGVLFLSNRLEAMSRFG